MVGFFQANQNQNVWACAYSVVLLNYNCAITSYIMSYASTTSNEKDLDVFATLSVLLGLFLGQIIFGLFGDLIGRKKSFVGSCILMFLGGIASGFSGDISIVSGNVKPLLEFGIYRCVVGIGAGGLYPIVAAITRESSQEDVANSEIAYIFGPIGSLGLIIAPLAVFILSFTNLGDVMMQRILLLLGAIPIILLFFINVEETLSPQDHHTATMTSTSIEMKTSDESTASSRHSLQMWFVSLDVFTNQLSVGFSSPLFGMYMLGTSLSWFFADMLHYGNILFQAQLINELIATHSWDDDNYNFSLSALSLLGLASSVFFWVGGLFSVIALKHISAVALQLHGFLLTAAAFFACCIAKATLPHHLWPISVTFYACAYFFNGLGPAPTTFLMPSLLFPLSVRSTANGLSAAIGNIGSILAVLIVGYISLEISNLTALFGGISILGMASTLILIRSHIKSSSNIYTSPLKQHYEDIESFHAENPLSSRKKRVANSNTNGLGRMSSSMTNDMDRPKRNSSIFAAGDFSAEFSSGDEEEKVIQRFNNSKNRGVVASVVGDRTFYDDVDDDDDNTALIRTAI